MQFKMNLSSRLLLSSSIVLGALLANVAPSYASEVSSPLVGGGGGSRAYNLDCGSGAVMIGMQYKAGLNIDNLSVVCRRINANGTLGENFNTGRTGGTGGFARELKCTAGRVVGSISVWAGDIVNAISLGCHTWKDVSRSILQNHSSIIEAGTNHLGFEQGTFTCPNGKPAKALRGRSGIYIDSVKLVCDDWNK